MEAHHPAILESKDGAQAATLWDRFRRAFFERLNARDSETLRAAWQGHALRTELYGQVLDEVAKELELTLEPEFLRVDWGLYDGVTGWFPIFIESENQAHTAAGKAGELAKLCHTRCAVGLLITVAPWSGRTEELPQRGTGGFRVGCRNGAGGPGILRGRPDGARP